MCETLKSEFSENKGILFSSIIPLVFGILMLINRNDSQKVTTISLIEKLLEAFVIFVIFIVKYFCKKKKGIIQISLIQEGYDLIFSIPEKVKIIKQLCYLAGLRNEKVGQKESEIKCNLPGEIKADSLGHSPGEIKNQVENNLTNEAKEKIIGKIKSEFKDEKVGQLSGEIKADSFGQSPGEIKNQVENNLTNEAKEKIIGKITSEFKDEKVGQLPGDLTGCIEGKTMGSEAYAILLIIRQTAINIIQMINKTEQKNI